MSSPPLEYASHSTIIASRSQNNCSQNLIAVERGRQGWWSQDEGERRETDFFSIEATWKSLPMVELTRSKLRSRRTMIGYQPCRLINRNQLNVFRVNNEWMKRASETRKRNFRFSMIVTDELPIVAYGRRIYNERVYITVLIRLLYPFFFFFQKR